MKPIVTLGRRKVLAYEPFLRLEVHQVRLPDGRVIEEWPWVITPDFVNIVALTPDSHFLCLRQYKYACEGVSLAAVGGYVEAGEDLLAAAKRELKEETGYESDDWRELGHFPVDSNRGVGSAHFYLAFGALKMSDPLERDVEDPEIVFLTRTEVEEALAAGQFKALPWAAAMALALLKLG
ncbi:MAG: NUDIX hydrolase [Acidobacteria bacterium]|nr:MAG: NUDIX hydrolase [Acidobacteriota bacterium]